MSRPFSIDFSRASSVEDLATLLGVAPKLLEFALSSHKEKLYRLHKIPKKSKSRNGEYRLAWQAGASSLSDLHKAFLRRFDTFLREKEASFPRPSVHGYVVGRSTLSNARPHIGRKFLLRADIANFFPSITENRIEGEMLNIGLHPVAAKAIAALVAIDGRLALGLHASPLIANWCFHKADIELELLAERKGCSYTRYADDLAFSSNSELPSKIEVGSIVKNYGFELSERKFRVTKRGQAHFVTGLSISDLAMPHVPKKMKRRMRQELYFAEKYGLRDHLGHVGYSSYSAGINKIDGTLNYVSGIETQGAILRAKWLQILTKEKLRPTYTPQNSRPAINIHVLIDETEIDTANGKVLALGLIVTEEIEALENVSVAVLRRSLIDPFVGGRKDKLEKKGLHFTDVHEEIRNDFIRELGNLPLRAYLAYGRLGDYEQTYLRLLHALLPNRLKGYDRSSMTVLFEQNPKIGFAKFQSSVKNYFELLEASNSRRPRTLPMVIEATKLANPSVSAADFFLGVFAQYAQNHTNKSEVVMKRFERLRDKYRLIVDVDAAEYFSRTRPFQPWTANTK